MWSQVLAKIKPGQLMTPGGVGTSKQKPFHVISVSQNHIDIQIGINKTNDSLTKSMFDAVDNYFQKNPESYLRTNAGHSNIPTANSVDAIVRSAVHHPRAIGRYVASILEAAQCVRYVMDGNRKHIQI